MTGADLRQLRESKGITLTDVAKAAKFTKSALSRIETGERGFDVDEYCRIMRAIGYLPGDFLPNSGRVPADVMPHVEAILAIPPSQRQHVLAVLLELAAMSRNGKR